MKKGIKANLYLPKECLNIILNKQDKGLLSYKFRPLYVNYLCCYFSNTVEK